MLSSLCVLAVRAAWSVCVVGVVVAPLAWWGSAAAAAVGSDVTAFLRGIYVIREVRRLPGSLAGCRGVVRWPSVIRYTRALSVNCDWG